MIPRLIVFLPVAAVVVVLLLNLEQRGRLAPVNRTYVEWLIANSRSGFAAPEAAESADKVIFLALSDPNAQVFAEWPPDALDYALLLRNLQRFEPSVVAIHPLLDFNAPGDLALRSINRAALALPSVVLGVPLLFDPGEEIVDPIIRSVLKPLSQISGNPELATPFTGLLGLPHERMRLQRYLAFNSIHNGATGATDHQEDPGRAVLVARLGEDLYPSLALETALLHARTPLATTRFRLGQGAGVFIRDDRFIPLNSDGTLDLPQNFDGLVTKVDAVELLTAGSAMDEMSPDSGQLEALRGNIAVLGYDDPDSRTVVLADGSRISPAELTARTVAAITSMPSIKRLPMLWQYLVVAVGFALCLLLLRRSPRRALLGALLFSFLNFLIGFLVFQVVAVWWTPTVPVVLFLLAGMVGLLVPLRRLGLRTENPGQDKTKVESEGVGNESVAADEARQTVENPDGKKDS